MRALTGSVSRRSGAHAGFTLVELLLALTLLVLVASGAIALVGMASREARRATQALTTSRSVEALQGFLQQELRDAMTDDITVLAPERIALARPVGDAMTCATDAGSVVIADSGWSGARLPEAGRDESWLLADPSTAAWQASAITDVSADHCPDGSPATRIQLASPSPSAVIRVMEPVELSAYGSGAFDWMGLTPASHLVAVQPFAGPLVPATTGWTVFSDRIESRLQPHGADPLLLITPLAPALP
ncbi:MAG: prepilin-type N-terminal cleavage/methylation domain-containing protein [Gemmatimonadales bacterium]